MNFCLSCLAWGVPFFLLYLESPCITNDLQDKEIRVWIESDKKDSICNWQLVVFAHRIMSYPLGERRVWSHLYNLQMLYKDSRNNEFIETDQSDATIEPVQKPFSSPYDFDTLTHDTRTSHLTKKPLLKPQWESRGIMKNYF